MVQDSFLDNPLNGAGTKLRIKTYISKVVQGIIRSINVNLLFTQHFLQTVDLKANNLFHIGFAKRLKHDHFINPVQKLRTYRLTQHLNYSIARILINFMSISIRHSFKLLLYQM